MNELINVGRLFGKVRAMNGAMKRRYRSLCSDGCKSEDDTFFADNYHTVFEGCRFLLSYDGSALISGDFSLADRIISLSGTSLAGTDEIIIAIGKESSERKICPCDIENLKFCVVFRLVSMIKSALFSGSEKASGLICILADIAALDEERINDSANPVSAALSADAWYEKSDRATRHYYRTRIYKLSVKLKQDPFTLAKNMVERSKTEGKDLCLLLERPRSEKKISRLAGLLPVFEIASAALLSLAAAVSFHEPLFSALLFLPALCCAKTLAASVLINGARHQRLLRLDPDCDEVKNTGCAVVLSAMVSGAEDADALYDRLYKLHAANPQDNVKICALVDLSPEQVPVTGDDRAVAESLNEVIGRLNAASQGTFSCFIRKRSYSKTQDEYMGSERKRGAIMELMRYMAAGKSDFYAMLGETKKLEGIKYVCAVDFDTEPYMDSVCELLAIALHPHNTPVIENAKVVKGAGIISPRMVTRLGDSLATGFSRGMGGIGSISSYDGDSMDLWQDVFGSGSFCGKGLMNVEAVLRCASGLPEGRVLSHDILEGELARTAYAGDIIFTEGFPKTPISYYKRLDRWIRGDIQNIGFIFSKRFGAVSKLKLAGNIFRAILPVSVLIVLYAGFLIYPEASGKAALWAMGFYLFPQLLGLARTVICCGFSSRRYFSGLLSAAPLGISSLFYSVVMLPTLAIKSARAVVTAAVRLISKKKLLEWTTSAAEDSRGSDPVVFFFIPEIAGAALLWSPSYTIRLFGLLFSLMPVVLAAGSMAKSPKETRLSYRDTRELSWQTADMWRFFNDYVTESENHLPPDNVQFAPVFRICHRTSPTNIGLYMLSVLAACDRKLISIKNMHKRLSLTLGSVEKMEKYKGNLYNWYETKTLKLCACPYVSSVDSSNFICSMVALKEGLKEYQGRCFELGSLIKRIEKLIAECDLSIFYDGVKGLMTIGINPETGKMDPSRYDFLMSESRLGSFYAIASRQVPKSHWQRLSRTSLSCGFYSGLASYSGTMFEYFMPELFIKSPESSLINESLKYALWCQKKYAEANSRPYGISESGYYAFDSSLSYSYMAHGVPKTGLRRGLDSDYVVSPYSTYISLGYSPAAGMENLRRLKKYGMYSHYGFYEAIDFTSPEAKGEPEIVKSCMSHHVGMSILASVNILQDGIFQKRFMSDKNVLGASELLCERVSLEKNVFEDALIRPKHQKQVSLTAPAESFDSISVFEPRMKLLKNSEYTLCLTDGGISIAKYRGKNVYARTQDCIMRLKGAFFGISDGREACSVTKLPDGAKDISCEFGDGYAGYYAQAGRINAGMKVELHKSYPCEIRSFVLQNTSHESVRASLFSYIEPSLATDDAESAHPAFSKMFLRLDTDPELKIITATRSDFCASDAAYMAIGFAEDILGSVSFNREEVLSRPDGVRGLFGRAKDIEKSYIQEPDPCIFINTELEIPPKSQTQINMFILLADSHDELINRAVEMKQRFARQPRAASYGSTAGAMLAQRLLPSIMFRPSPGAERQEAVKKASIPLTSLWELSVSLDIPLILLKLNDKNDSDKLITYLFAYRQLALSGIKVQLAVVFDDAGKYERTHYTALVQAARQAQLENMLYSPGGILPVDLSEVRPHIYELLKAYACHISSDEIVSDEQKITDSEPIKICGVEAVCRSVEYEVACGGFNRSGGYVINIRPPLPWCHVLSSRQFGTLVSSGSLGFSYAFNSRLNRLTPWDNDTSLEGIGERLILCIDGNYYDILQGAAAVFSPYSAEYYFKGRGFSGSVSVGVSDKGMSKRIRLSIRTESPSKLAYYCEPCLGADRKYSHLLVPDRIKNTLLVSSCASELSGYMAVACTSPCGFATSRRRFMSGDWQEDVSVNPDCIAACVIDVEGECKTEFYLSYALDRLAAENMPEYFTEQTQSKENRLEVSGCDKSVCLLAQEWSRYQALHARIWARTGFYQCSGAYGFRDQLQDAVGIMLENPGVCRSQILRCCTAQFIEGDVMHWWHTLPGKKTRGIRTRISDDNLWLVYAAAEYVKKTGDESILELGAKYSAGISLKEGENERYGEVYLTSQRESVFMHCKRAIDFRLGKTGRNGLMLMGTGDWNDGFSQLGEKGEGESVWLTQFFILCLKSFAEICNSRLPKYASELLEHADSLEQAVTMRGRENDRYLRAYADDGTVIGSEGSSACRIDSIVQSFAQFSGISDDEFNRTALKEAYNRLADVKRGVVKLFTPSFGSDFSPRAGYIQNYPDGLRENGGQYTHAAIWLGMACIEAGLEQEGSSILQAINPVKRSEDGGWQKYKTEPYYLCGDVYSNKNCYSRGGWSIYTGSAAWYYRALTEDILGIRQLGGKVYVKDRLIKAKIRFNGKEI